MPAYTPTTPPYKDQNIYICDVVDLPPEDTDVKVKAVRRDTYLYLKREMGDNITATEIRLPDNSGPIVEPLAADAVATPTSGAPGTMINYDGSGSAGAIVSYLWELDIDGGGYGFLSDDINSSFQPIAAGTYTLRLTVTDILDATAQDSVVVTIA